MPVATDYVAKKVYYRADCVYFMGGLYQARKDTGEPPHDGDAWQLLAAPGRDGISAVSRGTYDRQINDYRELNIVMSNGSSFIAKRDDPGDCPARAGKPSHWSASAASKASLAPRERRATGASAASAERQASTASRRWHGCLGSRPGRLHGDSDPQ